jgi:DNA polymerase-1
MILQVHDELVFEADAGAAAAEVSEVIRHEMETVMPLAVPVTVDIRTGASWDEVH